MNIRLLLLSLYFFSHLAIATGDLVSVGVTGRVIEQPCQVNTASVTQKIVLTGANGVSASSLYTPNSTSSWKYFSFKVDHCPDNVKSSTIQLTGIPDPNYSGLYVNNGTAKNVGIQVEFSNGSTAQNGSSSTQNIVNHESQYDFRARLYSNKGNVTAGTIDSVVTITLTWQ